MFVKEDFEYLDPLKMMPQSDPVVSVLVLAYNHGPYIRSCIESILHQRTSFPFEVVIGEDCSTDDTRRIVLEYSLAHPQVIRLITSENNVGVQENVRRIESAARGKYIAYCEGDDYWHMPEKLEQQVNYLDENSDYVLVHSDFRTSNVDTGALIPRSLGLGEKMDDSQAFNDILRGHRIVTTLTVCVRSSILREVLRSCPECYDPRFLMGDTQRWLEVARHGKVKFFPKPLATRQILAESATRSKTPARVLRFAFSAKDVLDHYIGKYGCPAEVEKATKRRSAVHILSCAFEAGDTQAANAAIDDCRTHGIPIPVTSRLHAVGSRSAVLKIFCKQVLHIWIIAQKVQRRLSGMLRSAMGPEIRTTR